MTCEEKGQKTYYVGESARTLYDRGFEHVKAIQRRDIESPMVEHWEAEHQEVTPNFKIEAIEYPRTTLLRQAT